MKKRKLGMALTLVLVVGTILGACGTKTSSTSDEKNFKVALVTDGGGIDDKSFNQSAWEGLEKFGKANGLKQGKDGYNYFQSKSDADYETNLNAAVRSGNDLVYGVGFKLEKAIEKVANQRKNSKFAIIDSAVPGASNVANINFKEQEGSFLVGVTAGLSTKSNKIGFVGGENSELINKFAAGFKAGVESVNKKATVSIQYVGNFTDSAKGQSIASAMYQSGADVIYQSAGGAGNGVFTEAINRKQQNPNNNYWVIGVDRDQVDQGNVKVGGKTYNVTLTSMVKRVDKAVEDVTAQTKDGKFPGGKTLEYGLKEGGVGISSSTANLSKDILTKVDDYKEKIIKGDITVPTKLEKK